MQVGDRVRVSSSVWDDRREADWVGWEGVVVKTEPGPEQHPDDPYAIYVFFPKARGRWRHFDFLPEELEVLGNS